MKNNIFKLFLILEYKTGALLVVDENTFRHSKAIKFKIFSKKNKIELYYYLGMVRKHLIFRGYNIGVLPILLKLNIDAINLIDIFKSEEIDLLRESFESVIYEKGEILNPFPRINVDYIENSGNHLSQYNEFIVALNRVSSRYKNILTTEPYSDDRYYNRNFITTNDGNQEYKFSIKEINNKNITTVINYSENGKLCNIDGILDLGSPKDLKSFSFISTYNGIKDIQIFEIEKDIDVIKINLDNKSFITFVNKIYNSEVESFIIFSNNFVSDKILRSYMDMEEYQNMMRESKGIMELLSMIIQKSEYMEHFDLIKTELDW